MGERLGELGYLLKDGGMELDAVRDAGEDGDGGEIRQVGPGDGFGLAVGEKGVLVAE